MIALNPIGTLLFNVGINTFSCIITLIIFYSYKRNFADTYDVRLLRKIEAIISLILLADIGMWILNGKSGQLMRTLSYADNIFYFLMQIAVTFYWLRYAHYRTFRQNSTRNKEIFWVIIPFVLLGLVVLASPLNGWCFYLDDANYYHRGVLSAPMSIVILAYLLSVSVIALTQYKKEVFSDRKKELLTIAFFVVPPFIGGTIQTVFYGISMIWPCTVISSLLVLLDKESQAISQDSLTLLNNRRNMERHLATYEDGKNRAVTMIVLDINDFKYINDRYGHASGDMALMQTANLLRAMFNGTSTFLARYGGDEFVIIMQQGEESTAGQVIRKIKNNFDDFNDLRQFPFQLSVSAGYAISSKKGVNRTANLFKEADANMYQDKTLYHRNGEI